MRVVFSIAEVMHHKDAKGNILVVSKLDAFCIRGVDNGEK